MSVIWSSIFGESFKSILNGLETACFKVINIIMLYLQESLFAQVLKWSKDGSFSILVLITASAYSDP